VKVRGGRWVDGRGSGECYAIVSVWCLVDELPSECLVLFFDYSMEGLKGLLYGYVPHRAFRPPLL
jgi:hypothetical protein